MASVLLPHSSARTLCGISQPGADRQFHKLPTVKLKNWRVIHACEYAHDILPVVEGQVAAGMRPYIVTPQGAGTAELYLVTKDMGQPGTFSLLRAWQDVRNWRKSLLECDPENSSDVVHTHSFASGMAGVRNLSCVVYDLNACIEELAISAGLCEPGSWMGRSFRVAEQFILSRAEAVIVHSLGMKAAVEERGAAAESVFLIPDPVALNGDDVPGLENSFPPNRSAPEIATVNYFVPRATPSDNADLSESLQTVLEASVLALPEVPQSQLLIEASPAAFAAIRNHAERLGIAEQVCAIEPNDLSAFLQTATVVIATSGSPHNPVQARQPSDVCLRSLTMGKPLLAADVSRNRDASPDGRGCLWFKEGDARDLGYRMAFLGRNPDFRETLAASGRAYILETRSSTAVGQQYDAAYRHAISRKKIGRPGQQAPNLIPITSAFG